MVSEELLDAVQFLVVEALQKELVVAKVNQNEGPSIIVSILVELENFSFNVDLETGIFFIDLFIFLFGYLIPRVDELDFA